MCLFEIWIILDWNQLGGQWNVRVTHLHSPLTIKLVSLVLYPMMVMNLEAGNPNFSWILSVCFPYLDTWHSRYAGFLKWGYDHFNRMFHDKLSILGNPPYISIYQLLSPGLTRTRTKTRSQDVASVSCQLCPTSLTTSLSPVPSCGIRFGSQPMH